MQEKEFIAIVSKIARKLSSIFKFGYHDEEDMAQRAFELAIEALDTYDCSRPLENFLWIHIRNRLHNDKRNKYERPTLPCKTCPIAAYDPEFKYSNSGCKEYNRLTSCTHYEKWYKLNNPKKGLMSTTDAASVDEDTECGFHVESDPHNETNTKEIFNIIDKNLPIQYRKDYIKMYYGVTVPKRKRDEIIDVIRRILVKNGINIELSFMEKTDE